jgi:hypothetical protein
MHYRDTERGQEVLATNAKKKFAAETPKRNAKINILLTVNCQLVVKEYI